MMTAFSPGLSRGVQEFSLKFLLVGDSDVGKCEILDLIDDEKPSCSYNLDKNGGMTPHTSYILLEGKRVKLQLWDTSGQGRFSTIIRSYSRGAQGILVVYDITNKWSFDGVHRWLREIDEHAPGVPRVLIGNRLHLEFERDVSREEAERFAHRNNMEYFEVSTLAAFNVIEALTELARLVLSRNGLHRIWNKNHVPSLQECCCRIVMKSVPTVHDMDKLPLPNALKLQIRSFADSAQLTAVRLTLPRPKQHRRTLSQMSNHSLSNNCRNPFLAPLRKWSDRHNDRSNCRLM